MPGDPANIQPRDIPQQEGFKIRVTRVFSSLPLGERKLPIVFIDDQPISWEMAYNEIMNDTALGKKISEKLVALNLI